MTDLEIIKAAKQQAHEYARSKASEEIGDTDQAAIDSYQADALGERRDLWNSEQELIYRMAYALQLLALGL